MILTKKQKRFWIVLVIIAGGALILAPMLSSIALFF